MLLGTSLKIKSGSLELGLKPGQFLTHSANVYFDLFPYLLKMDKHAQRIIIKIYSLRKFIHHNTTSSLNCHSIFDDTRVNNQVHEESIRQTHKKVATPKAI